MWNIYTPLFKVIKETHSQLKSRQWLLFNVSLTYHCIMTKTRTSYSSRR